MNRMEEIFVLSGRLQPKQLTVCVRFVSKVVNSSRQILTNKKCMKNDRTMPASLIQLFILLNHNKYQRQLFHPKFIVDPPC